MNIRNLNNWKRGALLTVAALALTAGVAQAKNGNKAEFDLASTGVDVDAVGSAKLKVRTADDGRFELKLAQLDPAANYEIVVDGVRVGDVVTKPNGKGRARFRSTPRSSKETLLGFDPRGTLVAVRNADGQDVLAGLVPTAVGSGSDSDTDVVCCIPDDSGTECEDRTPEQCADKGGTVSTATSCLPNPCDTVTVPTDDDVVCCIPDDSGPECEDRTVGECSAQGGIVVAATSCLENPCAAVPSSDPDTRCCLPDDSGDSCEDRTPAQCAAEGGVDIGPGICSIDACAGVTPPAIVEVRVRCEKRSSRSKVSVDGSGLAAGSYTAHVVSGASEATAPAQDAVLGEAEFDFASESTDIAAGATAIPGSFLSGSPVTATGQILDSNGVVLAEATVACTVR